MMRHTEKLQMLRQCQPGWDNPDSQPMNPIAAQRYEAWLATIPENRVMDAEPMLTDEGHIRMEWRVEGYTHIAEIGPDRMWLASLTPNPAEDWGLETNWDQEHLSEFFVEYPSDDWPEASE